MAELVDRLDKFNPFARKGHRTNNEDVGEEIDAGTVAGGGHSVRKPATDLRVSHALKSFIVHEHILSKKEVGLDVEGHTPTLLAFVSKPHAKIPEELLSRSHPLPEYYISSSHNTYLMAHQLYGASNVVAYETALRNGARCVEIDAWDNSDDLSEPKVTHGYTLVSHIPFRKVCETIRDCVDEESANASSMNRPSPILLSLENHCGPEGQMHLVNIMKEVWGDRLLGKAVRQHGHEEQEHTGTHVTLEELGAKITLMVEFHLPDEHEDSDSAGESSDSEDEGQKRARNEYKNKKKSSSKGAIIIPELAELGVYAQSVKPNNSSWFDPGKLINGPHHHLINVSESGLGAHLPASTVAIALTNAHHLMRVFPKGTRINSDNLKPTPFWGIGAQVCALNIQHFGTSNQLNEALFAGSDGYVLKPAPLRAGGSGTLNKGVAKKLRLHVAGATDIPVQNEEEATSIKPYLTCNLYHPDDLTNSPPKRKTAAYKQHKLGFLHHGENPPPTEPIWDETLEWEYEDNELLFLRMLIKSDDSWAKNPIYATAAVRLQYLTPGWSFIRMLDMRGHATQCSVLVKFEFEDA